MQIRVYYEDTDAGGIVYHSNYLNFCERARSEYFFRENLMPIIDGAHFVVKKIDYDFISSVKFGDLIEVSTMLIEMKKVSFSILHEMKKVSFSILHEIKKDEKVLFRATVLLVLVKDTKIKRLDLKIEDMLKSLFIN